MIKFIDANIFIEGESNPTAKKFLNELDGTGHCTSVLVLAEVYHKLHIRGVKNAFEYLRAIMGSMKVYDFIQNDLFNAIKNTADIGINDKIHIEAMKRNNIGIIISFDKGFDKEKLIKREEL